MRSSTDNLPVNFSCKLKQYAGVLYSIQFVAPFLVDATDDFWDTIASTEGQKAVEELRSRLLGAPSSFAHTGPLSNAHYHALMSVSNGLLRRVLQEAVASRAAEFALLTAGERLYAQLEPMECRELLWTDAHQVAYAHAMARANAQRTPQTLWRDGYLRESGIHLLELMESVDAAVEAAERWRQLIDTQTLYLPDRSCAHELENLPQEIAMGEVLARCVGCVRLADPEFSVECVVDVGGGNGFLAAQLGERLGCDAVVVDPHFPAHAIDCAQRPWVDTPNRRRPRVARRQALHRRVAYFRDTVWERDVPAPPQRTALVAKHLCGTAIDECLRHLEAQGCLPRVLVLAPCCFHKGHYGEYINPEFLQHTLGVGDEEGFSHVTKLTNWNRSVYQKLRGSGIAAECGGDSGLTPGEPSHPSNKSVAGRVGCVEALAESVDALFNVGRVQWLRDKGYTVFRQQYVPECVTPKNKCIVAYRV